MQSKIKQHIEISVCPQLGRGLEELYAGPIELNIGNTIGEFLHISRHCEP